MPECSVQVYWNDPAVPKVRLTVWLEVLPIPDGTPVPPWNVTLCASGPKTHDTVPPTAMSTEFGLNWESAPACTCALEGNAGAVTLTPAVATLVASACAAAVMVAVPAATAVTLPVWSTVAIAAFDVLHVTCFDALFPTVTVAVNCPWLPTWRVSDAGPTDIDNTLAAASTRTDTEAVFVASKVEVAVIVAVPGATAVT